MTSNSDWDTDAIARLRVLWAEGHSTAEIGRRMGFTKNAIIGKAHRLALPARASPIRVRGTGRASGPRTVRAKQPTLAPLCSAAIAVAPAVAIKPPAPAPATVRAASSPNGQPCCWPLGEPGKPGFQFCEAGTVPGKPYCPEHAEVAYVRPSTARNRVDGANLDRSLRKLIGTA